MTDLYSPTTPEAGDTGHVPIVQPETTNAQRFTLAQAVHSLRHSPVSFSQRVARSEYWWSILFLTAVSTPLSLLQQLIGALDASASLALAIALVNGVVQSAVLLISLGLGARRLHDTNRTGWHQLWWLVPIAGWIVLLVLLVRAGTPGDNPRGRVSVPTGERRSTGVSIVTLVGLIATLALSVALVVASVAAAVDGLNTPSAADTPAAAATHDGATSDSPLDPSLAAERVGGCWSKDAADGTIEPVACDTPNASYLVTEVVDEKAACAAWYLEADDAGHYLCLTKLG